MAGQTKVSIILAAVIVVIAAAYFVFAAYFPAAYGAEISEASARYELDENLVRAVVWTESKFKEDAVSPAGASGLMQLMPKTREWAAQESGVTADGSAHSEILLGCWYIRYLLDLTGDETDALMSYNAGYSNVEKWKNGGKPFPETVEYVRRVAFARRIYGLL